MTEVEMNIAIAGHLGWSVHQESSGLFLLKSPDGRQRGGRWYHPADAWNQKLRAPFKIPNYSGDLNAMHGLEMALEQGEYDRYDDALVDLLTESAPLVNYNGVLIPGRARHQSATAAQRAEAFLRTVGKWKEAA